MKNTAIITIRLFFPQKAEHDIEVPLNISAYDLFVAINETFKLGFDVSIKEECFLRTERPIAFLVGDMLLSDYNLRDGTIVNILPQSVQNITYTGLYIKDFDYTHLSFDGRIDLSEKKQLMIGNTGRCQIVDKNLVPVNTEFTIVQEQNYYYLFGESEASVFVNGKSIRLSEKPYVLHNYDFINILSSCFYYYNDTLYFSRSSMLDFNEIDCEYDDESIGAMHYPEFVRNSRLKLTVNKEPITLLGPKDKLARPKSNILLKLMPALGMIALTVILRGAMGGSNLSFLWVLLYRQYH